MMDYSQGTRNIMEGMSKHGVKRLICVSSSALELPPQTPFLSRDELINLAPSKEQVTIIQSTLMGE